MWSTPGKCSKTHVSTNILSLLRNAGLSKPPLTPWLDLLSMLGLCKFWWCACEGHCKALYGMWHVWKETFCLC
jgi:hypothetical protein